MLHRLPVVVLLLLSSMCWTGAVASSTTRSDILDVLVLGDATAEADHGFKGPGSVRGIVNSTAMATSFPHNITYRQIGPDSAGTQNAALTGSLESFLNFTVAVDPDRPTYLTITLYGSDQQVGIIFLYWVPPISNGTQIKKDYPHCNWFPGAGDAGICQLGVYKSALAGYNQMDLNEGGPTSPRSFVYSTVLLPSYMTSGRRSATLLLGGWGGTAPYSPIIVLPLTAALRPIYRVTTHLNAYYEPLPEPTTLAEANDELNFEPTSFAQTIPVFPLWSANNSAGLQIASLQATLQAILQRVEADSNSNGIVDLLNRYQVWGTQWNESLDIHNKSNPFAPPFEIYGAPTVPVLYGRDSRFNRTTWLAAAQSAATGSNNNPLPLFATFALLYHASWSRFYHNVTLIDRVVAGLDFFARQQGSNGAFLSESVTTPWCGAPNRTAGCGNGLDGVGPYSLGLVVITLIKELNSMGYLEAKVDPDLNGQLVTRRESWANMFNRSITHALAKRGGCGSQDLLQIVGVVAAQQAASLLQPDRPAPISNATLDLALRQVLGYAPQARNPQFGSYFTPTGMELECFGPLGGESGVDLNYGYVALQPMCNIGKLLPNMEWVTVRCLQDFRALSKFIYATSSAANVPYLALPTSISTRIDHQPDYSADLNQAWYLASKYKDPVSLRLFQISLMTGQIPATRFGWFEVAPGNALAFMQSITDFAELINNAYKANYQTSALLPSEVGFSPSANVTTTNYTAAPDAAWVEPTAAAVQITYRNQVAYFNFNYRHTAMAVSGMVRVKTIESSVTRFALVPFNCTDGFLGMFTLHYGPYFIAMNRNNATAYSLAQVAALLTLSSGLDDEEATTMTDLVSGRRISLSDSTLRLEPLTGWVLVRPSSEESQSSAAVVPSPAAVAIIWRAVCDRLPRWW